LAISNNKIVLEVRSI